MRHTHSQQLILRSCTPVVAVILRLRQHTRKNPPTCYMPLCRTSCIVYMYNVYDAATDAMRAVMYTGP